MPLFIEMNDIVNMNTDAIVNAANESLLGGGGVDGAIHRKAGPELSEECIKLNGCKTGSAKITKGYKLKAKYIIHAVGPVWQGGQHGETELLSSAYKTSLMLAREYKCSSVAFPLISAGSYGCPKELSLSLAVEAAEEFLSENNMDIYIIVYNKEDYRIDSDLYNSIKDYTEKSLCCFELCSCSVYIPAENELIKLIENKEESFQQCLFKLIDKKGISETECYKRANLDRRLFSKIRGNASYKPKKQTALALCIALKLDIDETQKLLETAGYTLSHSYKGDIITEFFIKNKNYNIFTINEALFAFDQPLLGA